MPILTNPRHERFAELVVAGVPAARAYVLAGYDEAGGAPQSAIRLRKIPKVKARIEELARAVEEKTIEAVKIDRVYVLSRLRFNVELAQKLEDDDKTPSATFNLAAANKSLELLGTEIGMFRTGVDHTHQMLPPEKMSEEQLDTWIAYFERTLEARSQSALPAAKEPVTVDVTSENETAAEA